ncbi:multidrug efflux MFS transporter permease subunit EmrB [Enterobacter pseudoroggenkampii]
MQQQKPQKPLEGAQLVIMTIALSLATFMQVLDSTIANVAIPTIAGNLGSSLSQGTWVITSFGVANAISIPITGWLAKRVGEVKLFLWSTVLFVLASWACGMSSSLTMLIFFRVIQGIVAGPLIPLSQSLLLNNYPPAKRSIALALWSMTVIVAPICGPILGGYISDNYHWGWIFFINVPIGAIVVMLTLQTLRGRETRTEQRRIDAIGLALLVIGIGSLQVMLDQGKELDWFNSREIIILTIVAVVSLSFLIVWELTDDNPIVDLSLFKSRNFTIGCLCISLAYMLYFGAIVLLPQLLQEVYGYTATWAGLASAPVGLIPVLLSPIIGRFAHKLDMRRLVTFSFIMYAVCFYWRAYTFEPGMDFGASAWPQFIQGFAVACFFMPLTTITLSGLPPERMAAASSLSNFTRTLAGSIGTSITTTLWTNRESMHHAQLTEAVNPFNPNSREMYNQLQGMGMTEQQASGWIAQQITNQGLIISANEIFWISAGIFIVLLGLVWFAKPPFGAGSGGGGAHWFCARVAGWRLRLTRPTLTGPPFVGPVSAAPPGNNRHRVQNATAIVSSDKAARLKSIHDSEKTTGAHHAEHTRRQVPTLSDPFPARPPLAGATHHPRAALALNRPARWQPGPCRADGQHAQAAVLGPAAGLRIQRDRGRFSFRLADGFQLCSSAD